LAVSLASHCPLRRTCDLSSCRNGSAGTNNKDANPFEEEEWEDYSNDALVDNGEPGVPVRALYDYEGVESDELSFKTGAWAAAWLLIALLARVFDIKRRNKSDAFQYLEEKFSPSRCLCCT
jgi:hypothetical protein